MVRLLDRGYLRDAAAPSAASGARWTFEHHYQSLMTVFAEARRVGVPPEAGIATLNGMSPLSVFRPSPLPRSACGAIPFGYPIGRFAVSTAFGARGNISATNAARVLGRRRACLPSHSTSSGCVTGRDNRPFSRTAGTDTALGPTDPLRQRREASRPATSTRSTSVSRRQGVATGAGTIFVLVPTTRCGVGLVDGAFTRELSRLPPSPRLLSWCRPPAQHPPRSARRPADHVLARGAAMVETRANLGRLSRETESHRNYRAAVLRGLHVVALGSGSVAFFNLPPVPIFESFKEVVNAGPSDRTACEHHSGKR